jgi:hypothetical protein
MERDYCYKKNDLDEDSWTIEREQEAKEDEKKKEAANEEKEVTFHDNTTSKWIQFNSIGSLMNR